MTRQPCNLAIWPTRLPTAPAAPVLVEEHDASGTLLLRSTMAGGVLHGPLEQYGPGGLPAMDDSMMLAVRAVARGFAVAVQISAPFIVFALLFNLGLGVLARMMPQLQVFFLAVPASIFGGMLVLLVVLGVMMSVFLEDLGTFLRQFTGG